MNEVITKQEGKQGVLVDQSISKLMNSLYKIEDSLKTTENLTKRAEVVEKKGRFKAIMSGISGKSDKELASIVKGLGANVIVTQKIVKFLIELAQHKTVVQEGFLDALDKKIIEQQGKLKKLGQNDESLDDNAKQVEVAVLELYKQVHTQVGNEVELRNNVDKNVKNISNLYEEIESKGQTDAEQSEKISHLIEAMREKTYKLEEMRKSLENKEVYLNEVANNVEKQSEKLSILEQDLDRKSVQLENSMNDLQKNTSADKLREKRIVKLESDLEVLTQRKIPQTTAYIAMVFAVLSLGGSIYLSFV